MTQDRLLSEQQGDSAPWSYEEAVKSFFDRRRFLKVLHDYIIFLTKDDELTKVILRQHQTRAVEKVIERVGHPTKRRGLIWHTQGSGKTLTMITIAAKLLRDVQWRGEAHGGHAGGPQRAGGATLPQHHGLRHRHGAGGPEQGGPAPHPALRLPRAGRLDDSQVRPHRRRHVSARQRCRAGGRGAPHHRRRPGQLPGGGPAQRHVHRFHRHPHRPPRQRQGHLQGLRRRRPAGLSGQVQHRRIHRRRHHRAAQLRARALRPAGGPGDARPGVPRPARGRGGQRPGRARRGAHARRAAQGDDEGPRPGGQDCPVRGRPLPG